MKYLISDNLITVFSNGQTHLISNLGNSYFDLIKSKLLSNQEFSESWISTDNYLQETTGGAFRYQSGEYFYNDEVIPTSIGARVRKLQDDGIPYQPLVNFWNKLKSHPDEDVRVGLAERAGSQTIPLTWDGDLVLYTRASWLPSTLEETFDRANPLAFRPSRDTDWSGNFEPGKLVQSSGDSFLPCGDFDWINGACPDQGAIYDIQVQPCHVVSLEQTVRYARSANLAVSQFRYLSQLRERSSVPEKVCFINVETNNLGERLVVRRPYSDESLRAYLTTLLPGSNKMADSQPLRVVVSGGC